MLTSTEALDFITLYVCRLSFFSNELLVGVEKAGIGIIIRKDVKVGSLIISTKIRLPTLTSFLIIMPISAFSTPTNNSLEKKDRRHTYVIQPCATPCPTCIY